MPDQDHSTDPVERMRILTGRLDSPELYEQALEKLPDALVITDEGGSIRVFNGQAELLFGFSRTEVLGAKVEILLPESVRERHVQHRSLYADEPRTRPMGGRDMLLSARHKSGREISVSVMLAPLATHEGIFVLAVVRRRRE